ncbi:glycosyltransferase family 2 protein [Marinobacter sp. 2_MG-2023]|uniref:glycosyltransferase n=1 Tax=Marinobacter sp. 2_MG-2023 TaxID=3062679 RepID=UPI0026E178A2|nr:glycosyltransferase family 2 protein [Marinobacter sp. 2_MG-2023]MDO6442519.1 glycosyltransferase family 2 protein [Marinobacter sp. 2_MG-2023]
MNEQTKTERSSPYFSIVIPAYNEEEHIGSCLQSIFNSDYDCAQYEVIVVDNGSQDRTYEIAINIGQARVFELTEGNVGAVRNYGAAKARGQILVFIDADCLMDRNWLSRAEKLIEEKPNCVYGGAAKLSKNATWIERFWLLERKGNPTLPKHLIGASTVLSKTIFREVGGFSEAMTSGEDTELHQILVSKGISIIIDHTFDIIHLGNAKTPIQFMKRQIWHSENYIKNPLKSAKDPIFIITALFILSLSTLTIQSIFSIDAIKNSFILLFCAFVPAILSGKRMFRARFITFRPATLVKIYFIDTLYIAGRSIGLLKGFSKIFR